MSDSLDGAVDSGATTADATRPRAGPRAELTRLARDKGVAAYVGEGLDRWSATHVADTARLYRLAFEQHADGARYHATAE